MTRQDPPHSPRTPEERASLPSALLGYQQAQAQGRPQFPAHSPVFPQAPTEPRPAAWVYAARSQTHPVGPTPQDGPRLRREVDGAQACSTLLVNAGESTSHVELARAGRDLRVRRAAGAVVTAAGRVQARNQVAPDTAKEQSTAHAVTVAEPLTFIAHGSPGDVGEVAPFTKKHAGPPVHSPEGAACSAVVGPAPLASRLSSSDALCCNQVGWGCPSRCRS